MKKLALLSILSFSFSQADLIQTNLIFGPNNLVQYGERNVVLGKDNLINGHENGIQGTSNHVEGSCNQIKGSDNKVQGISNYVSGGGNLVRGESNILLGGQGSIGEQKALEQAVQKQLQQRLSGMFNNRHLQGIEIS